MKKRAVSRKRASFKGITAFAVLLLAIVAIPLGLRAATFNSAADPNVLPMLNSFMTLPQSTLDENDAKVIAINNGASSQDQSDALAAANYPVNRMNLSNTKYLGGVRDAYIAADTAGEVPLVNQLLAQGNYTSSNHINLDDDWASSDGAKDVYNYQRPVCRLSGSINNYSNLSCPSLSFPSGHSRLAFLEGVSLAIMLPEVAPQIMARSAEIANYRAILGVHYPLDILGGRALATRMVAYRLHDDTWKAKFDAAKTQLRNAIQARCGMSIVACVASNPPSMTDTNALTAERDKLTYGFTRVGTAGQSFQAPDYSYELLAEAFPTKTQAQLETILESTAIDSGYPLDTTGTGAGTASIGWTRLDLAKALAYVDSAPTDTTAPTVSITSPSNGATISGTTAITATASDDTAVTRVEFYEGGNLLDSDSTAPYAFSWQTSGTVSDGAYTLTAKAFDAAGNETTSNSVLVTVHNAGAPSDTTAPTVSLTNPQNGASVSGSVTLQATATDNIGVTQVEFYANGNLLGVDTTAPYSYSWNTSAVANGNYTLTAKAYDAASNVRTSASIAVVVNNQGTEPGGSSTSFDLPGVKPSTTASFQADGVCAQGVNGQSVAAIPGELDANTILVGARFTLTCTADDGEAAVTLTLDKAYTASTLKVFKQNGAQVTDITSNATIATETVGGASVSVIRYTLQDGGFGDEDGIGNRQIADPIFVAFTGTTSDISGGTPSTPNTGFRLTLANPIVVVSYGVLAAVALIIVGRKLLRL